MRKGRVVVGCDLVVDGGDRLEEEWSLRSFVVVRFGGVVLEGIEV